MQRSSFIASLLALFVPLRKKQPDNSFEAMIKRPNVIVIDIDIEKLNSAAFDKQLKFIAALLWTP